MAAVAARPSLTGAERRTSRLSDRPASRNGRATGDRTCHGHVRRRVACRAVADPRSRSNEYNTAMKEQMGWEHVSPFEYYYDRGLYYHEVNDPFWLRRLR